MRPIGPETHEDRVLREWFDEQERSNIDRLEEGAKQIIQLVTGLYGVLFIVLALSSQPRPNYLNLWLVQLLGSLGVITFFLTLVTAFATLYPQRTKYQEDNLTAMAQTYAKIVQRKHRMLRIALLGFITGIGILSCLIIFVLWYG